MNFHASNSVIEFRKARKAVGVIKLNNQCHSSLDAENDDKKLLQQLMRDQTVKDLTQKLSNLPLSPQEEKPSRVGDLSGLISKAKEELAKNKNKIDSKATPDNDLKKPEPKKSEIEMHWEELIKNMDRDLMLCDLDFRDLTEDDETNVLMPRGLIGSSIPPPPPLNSMMQNGAPPRSLAPPLPVNGMLNGNSRKSSLCSELSEACTKKSKKTVRILRGRFWCFWLPKLRNFFCDGRVGKKIRLSKKI